LYQLLNYNELVSENVPIYLMYAVEVNGTIIKQRIYRLTWGEFIELLWDVVREVVTI
jgi:hypothetical protein